MRRGQVQRPTRNYRASTGKQVLDLHHRPRRLSHAAFIEFLSATRSPAASPARRCSEPAPPARTRPCGLADPEPVVVAYTYRTIANDLDGLLQLRVDQPTHGLAITLDYTEHTDRKPESPRLHRQRTQGKHQLLLPSLAERSATVEFDGWVLVNSGVAFTWRV